jgi:hypothetical protein
MFAALQLCTNCFSQSGINSFNIKNYRPSLAEELRYSNITFSGSDYKWVPKWGFSVFDYSIYSEPEKFSQLDFLVYYHTFFKLGFCSMFINDGPFQMNYFFPVGVKLPIINSKYYSFFVGANAYLFPTNIDEDPDYDWVRPKFIDYQLRLECNYLGLSAFLGYRTQESPWKSINIETGEEAFSGDLSGVYFGVSAGLKYTHARNKGKEQWEEVKSTGTSAVYERYIDAHPKTPFSNKRMLKKVALHDIDPEMRIAAVNKLDDIDLLTTVVTDDDNNRVAIQAISKITDQKLLSELIHMTDKRERRVAIMEKSDDPYLIVKIALSDSDPSLRITALKRIAGKGFPVDIPIADPLDPKNNLTFSDILNRVALNDSESTIRQYAAARVTDQNVLIKIALNDPDSSIRKAAIEKITDQTALCASAINDPEPENRLSAIKKVTDNVILKKVALTDKYKPDRIEAILRITEQNILSEIFSETGDQETKLAVIEKIDDQEILYGIARSNSDLKTRTAAFSRIKIDTVLKRFILEPADSDFILVAAGKLTDQNVILQVILTKPEWAVENILFDKLSNESLRELSDKADDKSLILAARVHLGEISWSDAFTMYKPGDVVGAASFVDNPTPSPEDIVKICLKYISMGNPSKIPELTNLLNRFGDETLAEDYLNCGNQKLYDTGRTWAEEHGYSISSGYGSNRATWGDGAGH